MRVRVHAASRTVKADETLAENYGVPNSSVHLSSGHTSKTKTFEIDGL